MVPRKHRVPKAVAPAKTGSTRKMQRKKKRERKKKAATPHPLLCCAALKPVHHYHHNATRIVRHKHDTLTRNLSRARIRHVHVHLTDSQVGRRNRWSPSVKQGLKMRQKVGIQVPQFVPMQRFFFSLGSWQVGCNTCSVFLRSLKLQALNVCAFNVRASELASAVERRDTRRGFCNC